MRIMIVDDDFESVKSLVALLKALGHHRTRLVSSAATALQDAVEFGPDIVFMDVELPDMSAYDVALLMHQHPKLEGTRLMALTDNSEHPRRDRAQRSGFERFVVKPVIEAMLREVLDGPSS